MAVVGLTGHRPDVLLSAIHRPAHKSTASQHRRPDATGLGGLAASQSVAGQMRGPHSPSLVGAVAITRSVVSEMSSVCVLSRVCVVSVDTSVFALSGLCCVSGLCCSVLSQLKRHDELLAICELKRHDFASAVSAVRAISVEAT